MTKTTIRVGDLVRHEDGLAFVGTETKTARVATKAGSYATLHGCPGMYLIDCLVPAESEAFEPPAAEKGVFVCVNMDKLTGEVVQVFGPRFDYWVDAERECQKALEFRPDQTFGVLKLVGTVSMKPRWS